MQDEVIRFTMHLAESPDLWSEGLTELEKTKELPFLSGRPFIQVFQQAVSMTLT
ncbi:hypothetical protein BMS3Abin08_00287 [bacterium BMS3Abin08]|nr:hypothetical protein BMS3Abin08_00287 [bacterium BMS3Abin08]